tara:strand:- start:435 stop:653 length:219 start_codon:yes stop_codon:yes gene_type:complete
MVVILNLTTSNQQAAAVAVIAVMAAIKMEKLVDLEVVLVEQVYALEVEEQELREKASLEELRAQVEDQDLTK